MKNLPRILSVVLIAGLLTAAAQPALGARLASISGEAHSTEATEAREFKLSEHSTVKVSYDIRKLGDKCSVQVRIYREQNGRWLVVNTVLHTSSSANDSRNLTLSAGRYRIQVIAKDAKFDVAVDM